MDIRIIIRLHELIEMELTGSPHECALKIGVSERTIYNYISYMKTEMNAPILYKTGKGSYSYSKSCKFIFKLKTEADSIKIGE